MASCRAKGILMGSGKWILLSTGILLGGLILVTAFWNMKPEYAYMPDSDNVANGPPLTMKESMFGEN
jgi:hypothetical protein